MPPSQLKKLKASLHQNGIIGQQKSKKKKRQANQNGSLKDDKIQKIAALRSIREEFNPFEVKKAKNDKYGFAHDGDASVARPGITKGLGEEKVGSLHTPQS